MLAEKATALFAVGLLLVASGPAHHHQETPAPAARLDPYNGCPMEGDAQSSGVQALNRLKNRYTAPNSDQINPAMTLAAIAAPGNDIGRWKVRDGATITSYAVDVKPGGVETVNCHASTDF